MPNQGYKEDVDFLLNVFSVPGSNYFLLEFVPEAIGRNDHLCPALSKVRIACGEILLLRWFVALLE